MTATIGAAKHERTDTRTAQRNGGRDRLVSTPAGDVELRIPKLRKGSFFPELLEPRRRVDRALWAVIMTAYITGTSTRKVDDLVRALGCDSGVSKSTVSRICTEIDEQVAVLRERRLDHTAFPYVFLDATYVKARINHQVVSRAVVIATGVAADGNREVLSVDVGDSEDELFWTAFLRGVKDRGLGGVQLVISDAHAGLKAATARVLQGAAGSGHPSTLVMAGACLLVTSTTGRGPWQRDLRGPTADLPLPVVLVGTGQWESCFEHLDERPERPA